MEFFRTLWQHAKYDGRFLGKTPGFKAIAVITLAFGIGANTTIFSLINAVMLRALPVRGREQLVVLRWSANKHPLHSRIGSSYGDTEENFSSVNPMALSGNGNYLSTEFSRFCGVGHPPLDYRRVKRNLEFRDQFFHLIGRELRTSGGLQHGRRH